MWRGSYDGNISDIHIRDKINSFYDKFNFKTFQKRYFDTIFFVTDLFIKHSNKNQQPDDVVSSKYHQTSENQGKNKVIDSTKNRASEKNINLRKKNCIEFLI